MGNDDDLIELVRTEEEERDKQITAANDGGDVDVGGGESRVWTMLDVLTKCRRSTYTNSDLDNLDCEATESSNKSKEKCHHDLIVIEDDSELEEGEIDDDDDDDDDDKVKLIISVLESITLVQAHAEFEGVCVRFFGALESLREIVLESDGFSKMDTLVQLSFASLQTINTVFCSMNNMSKELNKETMLKLLSFMNDHFSRFMSSNQLNEIEAMNHSLSRSSIALYEGTSSEENVNQMTMTSNDDSCLATKLSSEDTRRGAFYVRSRLPLLDLHKNHDPDSLPSPTRETTPSLPIGKEGQMSVYPYKSEASKAMSSYLQKCGLNSISRNDDLPSPTPSGEANDGNGDNCGDVSMSSKPGTLLTYGQAIPLPSAFDSRCCTTVANAVSSTAPPHDMSSRDISPPTSSSQAILAFDLIVKPSAKSRDPRLRPAKFDDSDNVNVETSADLVNPRKQKANDELYIDGTACKRRKSDDAESSRLIDNRVTSMTTSVMPTNIVSVSEKAPMAASTDALKDIAVNPTMLRNHLLKMGEGKTVSAKAPQKPKDPRRAAQLPGSSLPSNTLASKLPQPRGLPNSSQHSPSDEPGSIRLKQRDPRRNLHGSKVQTPVSSVQKQSKVNETYPLGTLAMKGTTEELETPSQLVPQRNTSHNGIKKRKISGQVLSGKTPDMVVVSQQVSNPQAELNTDKDVRRNLSNPNEQDVMAVAGPARSMNNWEDVEHLYEGYDDEQKVAIQKERERRLEEQKKMLSSKKLSLVLDLDHTLLNSAKFHEVETAHEAMLRKKEEQEREQPCRHLFRFSHMGMWTKLRPGIWKFLEKASKLYELHVYTMGNKVYATEMAKLLDPEGVLFNGRVISKGDDIGDPLDGDVPKIKDLEGVMGMESSVVIIDDSIRVWPLNKMNLIVVERYTYFPCSRRQFGLLGPSLLEVDFDERPEEGTLASTLSVIENIHTSFFSHTSVDEADVRSLLASEQRKILAGCKIVFSRIIPVAETKPHLYPLWQTAERFGAVCTTQVDDNVTHVVTNSLGTDKVKWALAKGIFVVHPGWVEASAFLYRRAKESNYTIKP
ncbi:unnamed protein product [Cochlearia groenlandica]